MIGNSYAMLLCRIRSPRAAAAAVLLLVACSGEDAPSVAAEIGASTQQGLAALGYAEWTATGEAGDVGRRGVTRHHPGRASPGLNVFKNRDPRAVRLTDMSGKTLHVWLEDRSGSRSDPQKAGGTSWMKQLDPRRWIGSERSGRSHRPWHWFEALPNGDLIGLAKWAHIERIDWGSQLLWRTPLAVHHDLAFDSEGRIYTLADAKGELTLADGETIPIVDDQIVILDPDDGRILERVPLSPFFGPRVERAWVDAHEVDRHHAFDVFHTNSIEVVRQAVPGVARVGDVLLSLRELDLVAVLDLEARRVVWEWGPGELSRQHDPSFLPNGNLLIFDNRPDDDGSRVIELDPRSRTIVWEHRGDPPKSFHSETMGGSQALPNGNVLVAESNRGRAFEVTRSGETVWEYWNPEYDERLELRATFYRFARLPLGHFEPGLLDETPPPPR